jgi:hypothetical protein
MDWPHKRGFDAGMLIGVQSEKILFDCIWIHIRIIADTDI